MVHADGPEETQAGSKGVHIDTCVDTCTQIVHTVGQGVSQLDVGSSTSLLHVIARDGDAVELRHLLRGVLEDVGNDLHGECRGIDVGVAHHELLQNIVLDGTCHLLELGALLQTSVDVEGQHGQHTAIHGHGDGHLVERNTCKEGLHILQRADGYTCLTYVAHHALVVGVVTTVCGKVKGYGQTLLSGSKVAAIEGVTLFCGGESCILTDGPRTEGIHHAIGATQEGRDTCSKVQVLHAFEVFLGIYGLNVYLLGSSPVGSNTSLLLPFLAILCGDTAKDVYIAK